MACGHLASRVRQGSRRARPAGCLPVRPARRPAAYALQVDDRGREERILGDGQGLLVGPVDEPGSVPSVWWTMRCLSIVTAAASSLTRSRCSRAPEGALSVAERIRAAISQPLTISGVQMHPSVSLGIARAAQGTTADGLLADADAALYRAKATGRGRSVLFTADLHEHASARLRLCDDLRHAVVGQQLRLCCQPLVDLQSGRRVGYQAVLRWQHPQRGLLLPAAFLVELMEGDQAAAATDWTLDTALADANAWTADAHRPGPNVAVNLHAGQLLRPDLPAVTTSALARHRLDPERLLIEVSDDPIELGSVQYATLQRLRDAGVNVAMTGFGTGHAWLHALRNAPADVIKLDSAFTNTAGEDPAARLIIEASVAVCGKLGRRILAEGTRAPDAPQAKPDAVWLEQDRHPPLPEVTQP